MFNFENIIVCPSCKGNLSKAETSSKCEKENLEFNTEHGIHSFLLPHRKDVIKKFLSLYQTNRTEEHWGDNNLDYYYSLPYKDMSGEHTSLWKMRAKSFDIFLELIASASLPQYPPLLDLGAGNCWLSLQMAKKGFQVIACDINTDDYDGLGVLSRPPSAVTQNITPIQAEFDYVPFRQNIFDIIVLNGSLHYASNVRKTIDTIMKHLSPKGMLFVLDSPVYNNASSGRMMIEERAKVLQQKHGNNLPEEFLGSFITDDDIQSFSNKYKTTVLKPNFGFVWNLRSKIMPLLLKRETASFAVIMLQKNL